MIEVFKGVDLPSPMLNELLVVFRVFVWLETVSFERDKVVLFKVVTFVNLPEPSTSQQLQR